MRWWNYSDFSFITLSTRLGHPDWVTETPLLQPSTLSWLHGAADQNHLPASQDGKLFRFVRAPSLNRRFFWFPMFDFMFAMLVSHVHLFLSAAAILAFSACSISALSLEGKICNTFHKLPHECWHLKTWKAKGNTQNGYSGYLNVLMQTCLNHIW